MAKKKQIQYTIWIEWNRPVLGLSSPPQGQPPFGYELNGNDWVKLVDGTDAVYENGAWWAHIGNSISPNERPLMFVHHEQAKLLCSRIPGAYIEKDEK
jgi:hypothetical protein